MVDKVALGRLGRPHGVTGELHLVPYNPDSAIFGTLQAVEISGDRDRKVVSVRGSPGRLILRLEGVNDRDAAAALTNREILVPREALPPLEDDDVYLADLVGLAVRDGSDRDLGVVEGIEQAGENDLLVVRRGEGSWLLPAVDAFLTEIDLDGGRLVVDLPEGLLELGLSEEGS